MKTILGRLVFEGSAAWAESKPTKSAIRNKGFGIWKIIPESVFESKCSRCGFLLLFVISLVCSCATPYQPAKNGTGYTESQIAPDQFRVTFQGNADTSLEQANDFALLRCAEIASQHGFRFFAVIDSINTSSAKTYKVPRTDFISPSDYNLTPPAGFPNTVVANDPGIYGLKATHEETHVYFRPGTSLVIKCFSAKPPKPFVFNAAQVEQQMKQRYRL